MRTFEVELEGFRGDTDETDHLIKWINSNNSRAVKMYLDENGMKYQNLDEIDFIEDEASIDATVFWYENYYECDECDITWTDEWNCMSDDKCPECNKAYSPSKSIVRYDW